MNLVFQVLGMVTFMVLGVLIVGGIILLIILGIIHLVNKNKQMNNVYNKMLNKIEKLENIKGNE